LYYYILRIVTIIMTVIKVTKIWFITQESSITLLEVLFTLLEASFMMFIVQASLMIVIYDRNMLIAKASR
jgi:hypothetical protein